MNNYIFDQRDAKFRSIKQTFDRLLMQDRNNKRRCQYATRYVFDAEKNEKYTTYIYGISELALEEDESERVAPKIAGVTDAPIANTATSNSPEPSTSLQQQNDYSLQNDAISLLTDVATPDALDSTAILASVPSLLETT